jgi:hypothetical protein
MADTPESTPDSKPEPEKLQYSPLGEFSSDALIEELQRRSEACIVLVEGLPDRSKENLCWWQGSYATILWMLELAKQQLFDNYKEENPGRTEHRRGDTDGRESDGKEPEA